VDVYSVPLTATMSADVNTHPPDILDASEVDDDPVLLSGVVLPVAASVAVDELGASITGFIPTT
jgi:hypothetical protein